MTTTKAIKIPVTLFAAVLLPFCGHTAVYDAVADFSTSNNPNGPWSYGQEATLGGSFSLLPPLSFAGGQMSGWGGFFPFIVRNTTAGPVQDGTTTYANTALAMHPGSSGAFSVLRWTAPSSGEFSLAVSFADVQNDQLATVDVHALLNGSSIFSDNLGPKASAGYANGSMTLSAGDIIDFVVGYGNGAFYYDHTAVQAVIAAVPDRASALLLLSGAVFYLRRCTLRIHERKA